MVRFVGCANPKAREDGYSGLEMSADDLALACRQIVDKPLLIEHEGNPVGRVESAWVGSDGRMLVVGSTDENTARGKYARNLVVDKLLPELSLGSTVSVNHESLEVSNKQFLELSLVERGLREGTRIERASASARPSYKDARVRVLCSHRSGGMVDAAPSPAVADPAAAAAAVPPPEAAAPPAPVVAAPAPPAAVAPMPTTHDELMARVAQLEAENKTIAEERNWMQAKTKRSYVHAFDAAAEDFLQKLEVEDTAGRDKLVASLRAMSTTPSLSGPEGNAVMEVVCAASRHSMETLHAAEQQLQELKRLKASPAAAAPPAAAASAGAAAPPPDFADSSSRHTAPDMVRISQDGRQQVARQQRQQPQQSAGQQKMFAWLSDGDVGQGIEHIAYQGVAGRDFSVTKGSNQY